MKKLNFGLGVILLALIAASAFGQESNSPVEMAKHYPPSMFNSADVLSTVRWQLKRLAPLKQEYEVSKSTIGQEIAELDSAIASLQESVSSELQFLDAGDRSKLVTRAMEQLLDTKLELAALESSVGALEESLQASRGKVSKLRQRGLELEVEIAQQRAKLAQKEYQKNEKLQSRKSITEQQLWRAKTSYEIANIELQAAQTEVAIEKEKVKAEFADQIADQRVQMKPVQAKIATLTKFLDGMAKSNEALSKAARLEERKRMWKKDLALVAEELFDLNKKEIELKSLEKLIEDNLREKKSKEAADGQGDSDN